MLVITPIQDKSYQKSLSEECRTPYLENCMAYKIVSEGIDIGILNFKIEKNTIVIESTALIEPCRDYDAVEIAVRGVFGFADKNPLITDIVYKATSDYDKEVARNIGFHENDGIFVLNKEEFFNHPCAGCKH